MKKYCPNKKKSPYNSIVKGLSQRIIRYLNRFDVEYADRPGSKCYWCIPFEGWHIKEMDTKERFVWKLRDELAEAMRELLDETLLENDSGSPIVSSLKKRSYNSPKRREKSSHLIRQNTNAAYLTDILQYGIPKRNMVNYAVKSVVLILKNLRGKREKALLRFTIINLYLH